MNKSTQQEITQAVDKAVTERLSEIRIEAKLELIERLQKIISSINDVVTLDDFYCVLDGMKNNLSEKLLKMDAVNFAKYQCDNIMLIHEKLVAQKEVENGQDG